MAPVRFCLSFPARRLNLIVLRAKPNKSGGDELPSAERLNYENSFDGFAVLGLGFSGMYYQLFNGIDSDHLKVTIFVKDGATGEVFDEIVYPDALEDKEK